jgi:tetratricopeptide (TPR) repeat protein
VKLDVVNLYLSKIEAYRTYVAELAGSPRAQALAQLALPLYMGEMLRGDTNITARLGVQAGPEAWIDYGINPVPYKWLYLGARARTEYEPARLAQENQAFWDEVKPLLQRLRRVEARRGLPVSRVSAQFARVANDFGIWCEEAPDAEAAERAYRTALELWPGNVSALLNLQQILARAGKTNEVASMKEPVEKAVLGARNLRIPGIARTYGHIRSRESLDRLLAIWKTPVVKPAWEDQIPRITDLLTRKELPAARRALETLIQQYPEAEQAWILLAAVAFDTQDDKLMERCVEQMRKQRREWPQVLMLLGEQAIRRGDVTTAMQYAERVAQLWPANARVLEFMLARHLEDRDFNKVELRVSLLLAVDPENTMANFSLGLLMLQKDQKKLAEDAFRHALKRDRHVPAINNLAWLLAETGRWSEAIPLAREATELAPQSPDVWDTLGYAYLVAGQYPEAESALVRAMELGPRHLSARCRYAVVLQRTGRVAEARKEAESILNGPDKLEPDQVRSLREILYAGSPPAGG